MRVRCVRGRAGIAQQHLPRLSATPIFRGAGYEAPVRRQDRGVYRIHHVRQILVADVEGGPQPLQKRRKLRGLEPDVHWYGDRPDVKTGVKSNRHLGPVRHVEDYPVALSDTPIEQSPRHAFDMGRQPRIGPAVLTCDECYAIRILCDLIM
jgi:hypothetical protein